MEEENKSQNNNIRIISSEEQSKRTDEVMSNVGSLLRVDRDADMDDGQREYDRLLREANTKAAEEQRLAGYQFGDPFEIDLNKDVEDDIMEDVYLALGEDQFPSRPYDLIKQERNDMEEDALEQRGRAINAIEWNELMREEVKDVAVDDRIQQRAISKQNVMQAILADVNSPDMDKIMAVWRDMEGDYIAMKEKVLEQETKRKLGTLREKVKAAKQEDLFSNSTDDAFFYVKQFLTTFACVLTLYDFSGESEVNNWRTLLSMTPTIPNTLMKESTMADWEAIAAVYFSMTDEVNVFSQGVPVASSASSKSRIDEFVRKMRDLRVNCIRFVAGHFRSNVSSETELMKLFNKTIYPKNSTAKVAASALDTVADRYQFTDKRKEKKWSFGMPRPVADLLKVWSMAKEALVFSNMLYTGRAERESINSEVSLQERSRRVALHEQLAKMKQILGKGTPSEREKLYKFINDFMKSYQIKLQADISIAQLKRKEGIVRKRKLLNRKRALATIADRDELVAKEAKVEVKKKTDAEQIIAVRQEAGKKDYTKKAIEAVRNIRNNMEDEASSQINPQPRNFEVNRKEKVINRLEYTFVEDNAKRAKDLEKQVVPVIRRETRQTDATIQRLIAQEVMPDAKYTVTWSLNNTLAEFNLNVGDVDSTDVTVVSVLFKSQVFMMMSELQRANVNRLWAIQVGLEGTFHSATDDEEWTTFYRTVTEDKFSGSIDSPNEVGKRLWIGVLYWLGNCARSDKSSVSIVAFSRFRVNAACKASGNIEGHIELHPFIASKRSVANPPNTDDKCLMWCYLIHKYKDMGYFSSWEANKSFPADFQRMQDDPNHIQYVRTAGVTFPVTIQSLKRFERLNDVHVNVYTAQIFKEPKSMPHRNARGPANTTKKARFKLIPQYSSVGTGDGEMTDCMNLLLIQEKDKSHFAYIHNMRRLMSEWGPNLESGSKVCDRCLHVSKDESHHKTHFEQCLKKSFTNFVMPNEHSTHEFKNWSRQVPIPFVIYADFECILRETVIQRCGEPLICKEHVPSGWCFNTVFHAQIRNETISDGKVLTEVLQEEDFWRKKYENSSISNFSQKDSFCDELLKECARITELCYNSQFSNKPTTEQWKKYNAATRCWVCKEELPPKLTYDEAKALKATVHLGNGPYTLTQLTDAMDYEMTKVYDHCHLTGRPRGAAHRKCNSKIKQVHTIPVIFHNLAGYDLHLFIKAMFPGDMFVIAKSMEKYITMTVTPRYRMCVDASDSENFKRLISFDEFNEMRKTATVDLDTKLKKEVEYKLNSKWRALYSLRFMDSMHFLNNSLERLVANMPPDYKYQYIFDKEHMLRKGVYPYEFMDSFEKFLLPSLPPQDKFFSSLSQKHVSDDDYAWAQMIWQRYGCNSMWTYHQLYLMTDVMLLSEVFQCFRLMALRIYGLDPCHYCTTPGLAWDACFKESGASVELMSDLDMYNFVESGIRGGVATVGELRKVELTPEEQEHKEIRYFDVNNLYGAAMVRPLPIGGYAWVDHPEQLNYDDVLNMAKEQGTGYMLEVDLEYPEHLHGMHNDFPLAPEHVIGKLMVTLFPKRNYVLHIMNLELYLRLGMVLVKVHKVLKFERKAWMRNYITNNHEQRLLAKSRGNNCEADFFKLMNNSVYGKTIENNKKHRNIKIVRSEDELWKWQRQFAYKSHSIIDENMAIVGFEPEEVLLNKPIIVGFTVLEFAKHIMYELFYCKMKSVLGSQITLLYTDTDSLVVLLDKRGRNWEDKEFKALNSNMDNDTIGMIKDECAGRTITGFVCLRAKSYALRFKDGDKLVNKGVPRHVNNSLFSYQSFVDVFTNGIAKSASFQRIVSLRHNIYSILCEKTALSAADDKRVSHPYNPEFTFAYGHCILEYGVRYPADRHNLQSKANEAKNVAKCRVFASENSLFASENSLFADGCALSLKDAHQIVAEFSEADKLNWEAAGVDVPAPISCEAVKK
jgi:hypothetical protein